ncbi:heavy metal-associated domain-containing protein [Sphingomonas sp.]|uniref:heavy-metal-associated domain-containing protein n=1 Tax=Sphingomonas sp. TaxID=28214 RepID=UPI0017CCC9C3|nr:heavy metal-associated domain-containing protein [Sphingomonas sp.]MBA3511112.1 heavy-metal-associated domain-containing protein [Sphingomonas sp.]
MNKRHPLIAVAVITVFGVGAVLGLAPISADRSKSSPAQRAQLSQAAVATIPVKGMICLSCAATIKQKLTSLDGVLAAEVHFANQTVEIKYAAGDPTVPAKAAAAIDSLGYQAGKPV